MILRNLKIFLISLAALAAPTLSACIWEAPERWHMFGWNQEGFRTTFNNENQREWTEYIQPKEPLYWISISDMRKAAEERQDVPVLEYLKALEEYQSISQSIVGDNWDYPSRNELLHRREQERSLLATCQRHTRMSSSGSTRSGLNLHDRWLLLQMRANMLLGNYNDNILFWEKHSPQVRPGCLKEMMRNIYANALLHTGHKIDAWNIYAEQNDTESMLWSARKFTNLAGLIDLHTKYPNAAVFKYLLPRYVNTLQDVVDMHYDALHNASEYASDINETLDDYWSRVIGKAYAKIDPDYLKEIHSFITFASEVAANPSTQEPCMWESAAALCSYFIGDNVQAKTLIDKAMAMDGTQQMKDMARRIRMLVYTGSENINSPEFKQFMATELAWLDSQIKATNSPAARNARDRIINLGLVKNYEENSHKPLAAFLNIGIFRK